MEESHQRTLLAAQGYGELQMYSEALEELNALPAALQSQPMVMEMRLGTLIQATRWLEALPWAERLCTAAPLKGGGFIHAAFILHELGRTAEARATLLRAPDSARHEANYHYNLACYECVLGHLEAARQLLATSFALDAKYKAFAETDPDLRGLRAP